MEARTIPRKRRKAGPDLVVTGISIPADVLERMTALAKRERRSRSQEFVRAAERHLEEQAAEPASVAG